MTTSVLCAIDINRPEAEAKVLQIAWKLAQMDGARMDVVTVLPDFGRPVVGGYFKEGHAETALEHARAHLTGFVEGVLGPEANAQIRHVVVNGTTYHEILTVAEKSQADLIVLGAHRPDLKDYLLGPNAARVVRHAQASVYVVR
ncbi:universal stress protein [Pseudooceanicola sp. HF7]|uniref:universal stress protein n=1 Tax=Pseudooceanicola sp. HF7 TaxID=2721560 RepID=UPI00142FFD90|nr:universal stress protein [Pseudooceanicola sp. HF7]NIZ09698.1 universal stress protein [Pseudooceanicola sp. HF7]